MSGQRQVFQRVISAFDRSRNCLCLVCRETGHVVENCPQYRWQKKHPGSTSILPPSIGATRPSPPFDPLPTISGSMQALCKRCCQLDTLRKIASHHPFVAEDFHDIHSKRTAKKVTQVPSLGPVRSLRLLSTCALYRLIFNTTHLPDGAIENIRSGGVLVVVTGWTIHRLDQNLDWRGCGRGKGPYARCIYTSVVWNDFHQPEQLVDEAVDAIGLINIGECQANDFPALGVRRVDPTTPDYSLIKDWLHRCDHLHHVTCRPLVSEGLKYIKLINVQTRQIVMYPPDGCDYIALSYVWGGVEQSSYQLGEILPTVPATLEDAMVVTCNLGKMYLWADSLCINQADSAEKVIQIGLMSAIYSGAWATIICLSGRSARSGLPRVGTLEDVVSQLSCEVKGEGLLSMMPTLSTDFVVTLGV